uniref:SURP motif domain-containing protein n=1 Tax=Globodera pallida TaxID=36090 RepID=A0A183CII4_GLOPA
MTKNVQAFDAYGTEFRFKKAIEIEKKRETKCDVPKCNKQPISQFCAEVEEDVEKEVIEQIGEAFQTVQMLQLLATPKKQKHFSDYFFMSFYTREDSYNDYVYNESLKKNYNGESKIGEVPNAMPKIEEMPNAESEIEEMPNAESEIEEMPNSEHVPPLKKLPMLQIGGAVQVTIATKLIMRPEDQSVKMPLIAQFVHPFA